MILDAGVLVQLDKLKRISCPLSRVDVISYLKELFDFIPSLPELMKAIQIRIH
jgi:hypothetical protein